MAATAGLALVAVSPATAAGSTAGPVQDGWIQYSAPFVTNSEERILQGSFNQFGECDISSVTELPPGQAAVQVDEIAHNPDTCESKVLISATGAAEDPGDTVEKAEGASTPVVGLGTSDVGVQAVRSAGYLRSYYEDPPRLDVNAVTNSTTWTWNGSSVSSPYGGYRYEWLAASGWRRLENNWQNTYSSYQTTVSSYVHFKNTTFCGFTTHTYYDRNTVHGRRDGYLVGEWNARKVGTCSGLLSFHKTLKRTQN
jgi:hypothetical protein